MKQCRLYLFYLFATLCSVCRAESPSVDFYTRLSQAALERIKHFVIYNGAYRKIPYPMGDVPAHFGVCTDEVIRSYRALNIDLQKEVHVDMRKHFHLYPNVWKLRQADTNIDHRRVPNLMVFFSRHGKSLPVSNSPADYKPGDLVTWVLTNNLPHIGIVTDKRSADGQRPMIVHNIGLGPKLEDMLFSYKITGHYRYSGPKSFSSSPQSQP